MISRRRFISMILASSAGFLLGNPGRAVPARYPHFFFAQIRYKGGDWDPNPQFVEPIVEELELRTSIEALRERKVMTLSDPELFYAPFLYMAGKYEFEPFSPVERERLRRFLSFGGFLLAEDTIGARGSGFDQSFRREMREVLPHNELRRLTPDHSVYQSFYMISSVGGRQRVNTLLEGITIDNWTPVMYCQNDLSGAWARDRFGRWLHECAPGGEPQRSAAFKTGINIIVYSLTSDYKKDVVHHPFIKRRQNQ
jgi:hypothetical protein